MTSEGGGASRSTDPAFGTSSATDVSLREYTSEKVESLRELTELRFQAQEKALELQATEYQRRLSGLNNEAARIDQAVQKNVSRDTWDAFYDRYILGHDALDLRIKEAERFSAKLVGGLFVVSVIGVANLVKIWFG